MTSIFHQLDFHFLMFTDWKNKERWNAQANELLSSLASHFSRCLELNVQIKRCFHALTMKSPTASHERWALAASAPPPPAAGVDLLDPGLLRSASCSPESVLQTWTQGIPWAPPMFPAPSSETAHGTSSGQGREGSRQMPLVG